MSMQQIKIYRHRILLVFANFDREKKYVTSIYVANDICCKLKTLNTDI